MVSGNKGVFGCDREILGVRHGGPCENGKMSGDTV